MRFTHVAKSVSCHPFRVLLTLAAGIAPSVSTPAQADAKADWEVDDVVMQERSSGWQISRDGRRALWIRSRADREADKSVGTLMLLNFATGKSRPLTVGQDPVGSPRFAPDGTRIAFLTSRDFPKGMKGPAKKEKGQQVWMLDLRGGEAHPVTKVAFGVRRFVWGDDETLFLSARDPHSRREAEAKKDKDDTRVVEDLELFRDGAVRLFRLRLNEKESRLRRLTTNRDQIGSFVVSPDMHLAIAVHAVNPAQRAEGRFPPKVMCHDLRKSISFELYGDRKNKPRGFDFWLDGKGVYVRVPHSSVDGEPTAAITRLEMLRIADLQDSRFRPEPVDLAWDNGMSGSFVVTTDGFLTGLANGVRPRWARYRRTAKGHDNTEIPTPAVWPLHDITKARDADRILCVVGSASEPDHVLAGTLEGTKLTGTVEVHRPNGGFAEKWIAKTEVVSWKGAKDESVEGIVYWPKGYTKGRQYPLVMITHGGPHSADRDRFSERYANSPNFYCQRGAFVLKTNYHGSSSYGLAFGESIKHRYYELEVIDLFRGIQRLVDLGLVDPKRIGLVGWSNGAILATAMLTHGEEHAPGHEFTFRVAAPGAGDVNWASDYGNCAFGASFDEFYIGGTPWDNPQGYLDKSPLFRLQNVTTPTIIFFGTEDTNVPTEQGWEHYRAMHRIGRAPVRFLLFPGEPHGLRKLSHQRRKLTEELAWVDRYLFDKGVPTVDLVASDAPLSIAQRRRAIGVVDAAYGKGAAGVLVPETVPFGDVNVGRFEVTRRQWKAFRTDYRITPGTDNLPIVGVSAADAVAYCEWLSEKTGARYRLPTAAEFDTLLKSKGKAENDLIRWAGYKPSIEDAERLRKAVIDLGLDHALLAVGSCPPGYVGRGPDTSAKEMVFDIDGNAAEWVKTDDGFAARGGCSVCAPDPRARPADSHVDAPADFTGFRVIQQR